MYVPVFVNEEIKTATSALLGHQGWSWTRGAGLGFDRRSKFLFQKEEEEFSFGRGEEVTNFSLKKVMIQLGEIFVFWSLLKTIFRKIPTPKQFLKIDHF